MMYNRLSKIFQPIYVIPNLEKVTNFDKIKSHKLMLELGIIRQASHGCYDLLPLGIRSLNKLIEIIDKEMSQINAQKMLFTALTNSQLWRTSGRYDSETSEIFKIRDRNFHTYILSPTHEENASDLLASVGNLSYRSLPIRLYQISSKYRDEIKPRFGLMRSRQFLMKDLYTFDVSEETASDTYETVCDAYDRILQKIGISYVKVSATTGNIGGLKSHEYHYLAEIGEDEIVNCSKCGFSFNTELYGKDKCNNCDNTESLQISPGIEVGHTFLLGDKYSKPLQATYLNKDAKRSYLQMGSYGLGISRLLAASIEVLSTQQEMRWPEAIVPYSVVIIPPKRGSIEELATENAAEKLYEAIDSLPEFKGDVLLDDRTSLTIGRRYLDARRVGYPYIIAIGKRATENPPRFEVNALKDDSRLFLSESDVIGYLMENSVSE